MSDTDYNEIAKEYRASKLQSWRAHVEAHTLLKLAGDVRGKSVIDLACGEGHYARTLRKRGANVVGVDAAARMIELARAAEQRAPLGVEYQHCDVRALCDGDGDRDGDHAGKYDIAFAAWLLNYARDAAELGELCAVIARVLKPGGRLVAINTEPNDPPDNFEMGRRYGFVKRVEGRVEDGMPCEGAAVIWTLFLDDGAQFDIVNYHLSRATVETCMHAAGLRKVRWHAPQLSPDATAGGDGHEHWQPLLTTPPFAFIECHKP